MTFFKFRQSRCSGVALATVFAILGALMPLSRAQAQVDQLIQEAEAGDVEAQVRLGYEHRDGRNRAEDHAAAVKWFAMAAAQGNSEAIDNLGWLNEQGMGLPQNRVKARQLYRQAAEKNHAVAQLNLARCLREGIGGPADPEEALRWCAEAFNHQPDANAGNALAMTLLAVDSLRPHQDLLAKLGETDSSLALASLGRIYHEGLGGIAKDSDKVADLFVKARRHGLPPELLDPLQLDELAERKPVAKQFGFLPTIHIDQGYNMCAPTSAAMTLRYYVGKPVDPYAIKNNSTGSGPVGTGTCWDHLLHGIKHVSGHEWQFKSFPHDEAGFEAGLPVLLAEIDARRPVLIDLGPHTVVLVGYDAKAQVVYIQNPAYQYPGVHAVTYDRLKESWHSPWHVSTTNGVSARPALLTGDKPR